MLKDKSKPEGCQSSQFGYDKTKCVSAYVFCAFSKHAEIRGIGIHSHGPVGRRWPTGGRSGAALRAV